MVLADEEHDEKIQSNVNDLFALLISRLRSLQRVLQFLAGGGDDSGDGNGGGGMAGVDGGREGGQVYMKELTEGGRELQKLVATMQDVELVRDELMESKAALEAQACQLQKVRDSTVLHHRQTGRKKQDAALWVP